MSDPLDPRRLSSVAFEEAVAPPAPSEDPDTNGEILLITQGPAPSAAASPEGDHVGTVYVYDVSDPARPFTRARMPGVGDHTLTCILDCTWAYGGTQGIVIDLRDPDNPKLAGNWTRKLKFHNPPNVMPIFGNYAHDVTEVAPGLVLTASNPMYLLDAREDPAHPKVLALSDGSPHSYGGVAWPNRGRDALILSFQEPQQGKPSCRRDGVRGTSLDTAFKTWDARGWKQTGFITGIDEYFPSDGTFTDGNPPVSVPLTGGCAASWFDVHPDFRDGGLVAGAFASNGVKFLRIAASGKVKELGYWLPHHVLFTVDAEWLSRDIVYATGLDRGIDILRFTGRT